MKMTGSQVIDAPRAVVWKGLNDPKILQACIPGCEKINAASPTELSATVVMKVGPVKASFSGDVKLSELNPPESYRISGQGNGGLAGFASGGATVKLTELSPTQTQMDYDVDAQVGGKMAMLGARMIDSTAQSLAEQFFTRFAAQMKIAGAEVKVAAPKKAVAKKPAKKVVAKKALKKSVAKSSAKKVIAVKKAAPKKKVVAKKVKKAKKR